MSRSPPNSYDEIYWVPSDCLKAFEHCRETVRRHIEIVTTTRYEWYLSQKPMAVAQAWCDLVEDKRLPEDVPPTEFSADKTSHEQRYTILRDKATFKEVAQPGHGRTKERLERILWEILPQKCDANGGIVHNIGEIRYEGSRTCDWWIRESALVSGGLLFTKGKDRRALLKICAQEGENLFGKYESGILRAAWKALRRSLKELEPFNETNFPHYANLLGELQSSDKASHTVEETESEPSEDNRSKSGSVTPTQSQTSEASAAGTDAWIL